MNYSLIASVVHVQSSRVTSKSGAPPPSHLSLLQVLMIMTVSAKSGCIVEDLAVYIVVKMPSWECACVTM